MPVLRLHYRAVGAALSPPLLGRQMDRQAPCPVWAAPTSWGIAEHLKHSAYSRVRAEFGKTWAQGQCVQGPGCSKTSCLCRSKHELGSHPGAPQRPAAPEGSRGAAGARTLKTGPLIVVGRGAGRKIAGARQEKRFLPRPSGADTAGSHTPGSTEFCHSVLQLKQRDL